MAQVKVTLVKSLAGRPGDQRATVVALGLHKTNSSVVKEVTPQIKGMLHKVEHLVKVDNSAFGVSLNCDYYKKKSNIEGGALN